MRTELRRLRDRTTPRLAGSIFDTPRRKLTETRIVVQAAPIVGRLRIRVIPWRAHATQEHDRAPPRRHSRRRRRRLLAPDGRGRGRHGELRAGEPRGGRADHRRARRADVQDDGRRLSRRIRIRRLGRGMRPRAAGRRHPAERDRGGSETPPLPHGGPSRRCAGRGRRSRRRRGQYRGAARTDRRPGRRLYFADGLREREDGSRRG